MTPAHMWLRQTYPEVFRQFYTKVEVVDPITGEKGIEERPFRRPLKLGAMADILADPRRPDTVSKTALKRAVAAWTGHEVYLRGLMLSGASRWTLDGKASGTVSNAHRKKAYMALVKRREARATVKVVTLKRRFALAPQT